jgi:predicted nucleotidyltransferase
MRRRAIRWLADEDLISPDVAERARAEHPEPVVEAGFVDVLVLGSQARCDAGSDSDVDLLVVLSDLADAWEELRRMEQVLRARSLLTRDRRTGERSR